jgi:hypothetical protein
MERAIQDYDDDDEGGAKKTYEYLRKQANKLIRQARHTKNRASQKTGRFAGVLSEAKPQAAAPKAKPGPKAAPTDAKQKDKPCFKFINGKCALAGKDCKFSHSDEICKSHKAKAEKDKKKAKGDPKNLANLSKKELLAYISSSSSSSDSERSDWKPLTPEQKKVIACRYFIAEKCTKGDDCPYSHDASVCNKAKEKAKEKGKGKGKGKGKKQVVCRPIGRESERSYGPLDGQTRRRNGTLFDGLETSSFLRHLGAQKGAVGTPMVADFTSNQCGRASESPPAVPIPEAGWTAICSRNRCAKGPSSTNIESDGSSVTTRHRKGQLLVIKEARPRKSCCGSNGKCTNAVWRHCGLCEHAYCRDHGYTRAATHECDCCIYADMPDWEPNISDDDDLIINHIHDDTVDEVSDEEMAFFDAIRARIMEGRNVANVGAEPPAACAAGR